VELRETSRDPHHANPYGQVGRGERGVMDGRLSLFFIDVQFFVFVLYILNNII